MLIPSHSLFIHWLALGLYFVVILLCLTQRGVRDRVAHTLAIFLGIAALTEVGHLLVSLCIVRKLPEILLINLGLYGLLLQSFFLFQTSESFFRRRSRWVIWLLVVLMLSAVIVLDTIQSTTPYIIRIASGRIIPGWVVTQGAIFLGWSYFMLRIIWQTFQTYRQEELVVTRVRIRYWFLALAFLLIGDLLVIGQQWMLGRALILAGSLLVSFVVLNTRLPDFRGTIKQSVAMFVTVFLELILYSMGFMILLLFLDRIISFDPLLVSVILGFIILSVFKPFTRLIRRVVERVFFGIKQDYSQILREYSKKIGNVLELDLLSKEIIKLIDQWMEVDGGALYTVDREVNENAQKGYRLLLVQKKEESQLPSGFLKSNNPIAVRFHDEKKPVTISEIEMLPKYHQISGDVRKWFKSQRMDIFLPIFGKGEWIGLLALGPKKTGVSYSRSNIRLLESLADQTSVALQNARLVESIVRVNHEFKRAYAAMEEAHTRLERLDRTKSDFISIASHELRTPLTVLHGYSQMLNIDSTFAQSDYYQKIIKGISEGTSRLQEIVDDMLEIARIDTRLLELKAEAVSMPALIHDVSIGFKGVLKKRDLNLSFRNLENLPSVLGDPEALKKVFFHLLSNAIKYTPDGGSIKISGSVLPEGDRRLVSGGVEMVVSDTGIGVDPRYKDLIFTKFYRTGDISLHSSGKTKFKGGGPGLGLAIVRGIVEAHGGCVWVESPGFDEDNPPGSDFHFVLPIEP